MDWLADPFEFAFQQRALFGGLLAAVTSSVVGTWVVIRGMSFLGDALVHGVIPGIALALLVGFHPLIGAALAAVVMILGIGFVHRRGKLGEDTGIGLLFVGMLALGVVIASRMDSFTGSLTSILFGDALGVTAIDLLTLGVITGIVIVVSVLFYRPFLVLSFNSEKAKLLGLRPGLAHMVMLALITLAIVGSFRTVGTLLVFGLLIGPPATATLLTRTVPATMLVAGLVGMASVVVGLILSFHLDTSASATMAMIPVITFFVVLSAKQIRET